MSVFFEGAGYAKQCSVHEICRLGSGESIQGVCNRAHMRGVEMKGWKSIAVGCAVLGLAGFVSSVSAAEEASKWDTAGDKIMEASHAVSEATEDSALKAKVEADKAVKEARKAWEEAKQKSKEMLDAARQKYEEELEKARARIHAATAPHENVDVVAPPAESAGD